MGNTELLVQSKWEMGDPRHMIVSFVTTFKTESGEDITLDIRQCYLEKLKDKYGSHGYTYYVNLLSRDTYWQVSEETYNDLNHLLA
jgi:hypothetical protein